MALEAAPLDISTMPELARVVEEVARTRRPRALQQGGETVALLVPVGRKRRRSSPHLLVDTSGLPPLRYRNLEELIQDREPPPPRAFTDEEIKEALDHERAEAWRRKQQRMTRSSTPT